MDKNLVNLTPQAFADLPQGAEIPSDGVFAALHFPHKKLEQGSNGYKIYKDAKEFVMAEGQSAAEALEKSGVANPYKIVRASRESNSIIAGGLLTDG